MSDTSTFHWAWCDGQPARGDVAVMPGEAITDEVLEYKAKRERLLNLISMFRRVGFSRTIGRVNKITSQTASAASAFIRALPERFPLPKVVPDGEGGLLLAWTISGEEFLLVVDNWLLHGVKDAGTPRAVYIEGIPFDGENIPEAILFELSMA